MCVQNSCTRSERKSRNVHPQNEKGLSMKWWQDAAPIERVWIGFYVWFFGFFLVVLVIAAIGQ